MPNAPAPELLTAQEIADTFRVSRSTVQRWHTNGTLTGIKVGGTLRFRRSDVEKLLEPDESEQAS